MDQLDISSFDFDAWAALARKDPEAFEQRRREAIEQAIAAAPPRVQRRLRGLQWRVDMERGRCAHPVAACAKTFNMMWDSVYGEGGLLASLNGFVHSGGGAVQPADPSVPASVLAFRSDAPRA